MDTITQDQADRIIELLESINQKLSPDAKTVETLPDVLTVEDIKSYLNIGRTKAFEIISLNEFTKLQLGRKTCIPKDQFVMWTERNRRKRAIGIEG